jgi:hypothetical protein
MPVRPGATFGDAAMKRVLVATLAAALVLSPATTRPAAAEGGGELLGLLLGIGTVYAIGKGIEQARRPAPSVEPVDDRRTEALALASAYRWATPDREAGISSACCLRSGGPIRPVGQRPGPD